MAVPDRASWSSSAASPRGPTSPASTSRFPRSCSAPPANCPSRRKIPPAGSFEVNKLARERHEHWLTQRFFDADSRIVEALATPGDRYLRADMKTDGLGWLAWDYDGQRLEEIRVESFNASYAAVEVWLSLDRPAERDPKAGPPAACRPGSTSSTSTSPWTSPRPGATRTG